MSRADETVLTSVDQGVSTTGQDTGTAGQGTGTSDQCGQNDETQVRDITIRFKVRRISHLDRRYSSTVLVYNLPWRILVVQKATSNQCLPSKKSLGFFLQCSGYPDSPSWSCSVRAELRLISQKLGVKNAVRTITHVFNNMEDDWGYSHFTTWSNAIDPEKGFCKNDTIICEVLMRAEEPRGVSWDTKEHSEVGDLEHQRTACHINSMLQTLSFTNELRRAVYQMPTKDEELSTSVTETSQKVLHEWQLSDKPISMKRLEECLRLATLSSLMQQDIKELCRDLLDNVEFKLNGTCVQDTIRAKLNEGSNISTITCKHVNYQSKRIKPFYEVQLDVKGKKNIVDSLKEYCAKKTLDADNKYDAGAHGLQDAEKSIIFKSLPPVLHLYLLRCQSDNRTSGSDIDISGRYEFSEKLDLSEFLEQKEDTPAHYTLHAVLVHSADKQGDHYAAFINTKCEDNWCKFDNKDDFVVSPCTKQEAIEHNFGARSGDEVTINQPRSVNACMLVYIRDSALPDVLQKVEKVDIPKQLMERLQKQQRVETQRRNESIELQFYTQVQIVLEEDFDLHHGADLINPDKCKYRNFKVRKTATVSELTELISAQVGLPVTAIRPWRMAFRTNQTFRPTVMADMSQHVQDLLVPTGPLTIFVETVNPNDDSDTNLPFFDQESDLLMFFKLYDPYGMKLSYIGHQYIPIRTKLRELVPELNRRAGFDQNTPLLVFEEVQPDLLEPITDLDKPLIELIEELMNGDIICFTKYLSSDGAHFELPIREKTKRFNKKNLQSDEATDPELPNIREYFKCLQNRVEVLICDKSDPNDIGFVLELSLKMKHKEIVSAVALRLETHPELLQLFKAKSYCDAPGYPLWFYFERDLRTIFKGKQQRKIYFERLPISLS